MVDGVRQVWISISSCHVSSFVTLEKLINLSELLSWSEMKSLSRIRLFATPWTVAYEALSMGFSRILEWVAISFSRGSSQPRDRTWVSRIAGRCFTVWATREAQMVCKMDIIPIVLLCMLYNTVNHQCANIKVKNFFWHFRRVEDQSLFHHIPLGLSIKTLCLEIWEIF